MKPERSQQIERLHHAASKLAADQRTAFLRQECHGDEELRAEVESLLTLKSETADSVESPAFEVAAKLMAQERPNGQPADPITVGAVPGRFRVLERMRSGGMDAVHKAEDTRLQGTSFTSHLPER